MRHKLLTVILILFSIILSSCDEDKTEKRATNYLVDFEKINSTSETSIKILYKILLSGEYKDYEHIYSNIKSGVKIYKIIYKTKYKNKEINASGLIAIPDKKIDNISFLSYQHGTILKNSDCPSENSSSAEFNMITSLSSLGFVVLIPDYIGFGASSNLNHPYLCYRPTVDATLDFIEAAREFLVDEDINISAVNKLYLTGYSQGGWATLAALQEIEVNNYLDIDVVATSCGSGPYNIIDIQNSLLKRETYDAPYYLPYVLYSMFTMNYITTPLNKIFNSKYSEKFSTIFNGDNSGSEANSMLTTNIKELLTADYILNANSSEQYSDVITSLNNNSIKPWLLKSELHLIHGDIDSIVPPIVSDNIYDNFIKLGVSTEKIKLVKLTGKNHNTAAIPAILRAVDIFTKQNTFKKKIETIKKSS